MLGPKETLTLQQPTETRTSTGSLSKTWTTITTFPAVVDRSHSVKERVSYGKETVFADYRIMVDINAINTAYHPSLKEKNRIQITEDGSANNFDIKGVVKFPPGYLGAHFEVFLERVK